VFLQVGILVVFSHPKENAQEISDKGHHTKAAYHRSIGIEGKVSGGHQQGSHRRLLQHYGQLGVHAFLHPGLTAVAQDYERRAWDGEETCPVPGHRRAKGSERVQRLHQWLLSLSAVSTSHQPGQFEGELEKSDVEKLLHITVVLRKKNMALMETVSELKMAY